MTLPPQQRIFVVGCPRSGTTLVQSLLAAHPALTSFTESHFFSDHFRPLSFWPWCLQVRDTAQRVEGFLAENAESGPVAAQGQTTQQHRPALSQRRADAVAPWRVRPGHTAARQLVEVLDRLAEARQASGWIEKTPRHLHHLNWLERYFGNDSARLDFVHVVRPGAATVRSLEQASRSWSRPYSRSECVARWNSDTARTLRRLRRVRRLNRGRADRQPKADPQARDHLVLFDRLVSEPGPTIKGLCTGLGLDSSCDLQAGVAAVADQLVLPEESWKQGLHRPLGAHEAETVNASQHAAVPGLRSDLYQRLAALAS